MLINFGIILHVEFIKGKWMKSFERSEGLYQWDGCIEPSVSYLNYNSNYGSYEKSHTAGKSIMQRPACICIPSLLSLRLLPSGLKAWEPALHGTRSCENRRLWIGPGDPIQTSIHRLRIYQMVNAIFFKNIWLHFFKSMSLYWGCSSCHKH